MLLERRWKLNWASSSGEHQGGSVMEANRTTVFAEDDIIVVSSHFAYALAKHDWGTANEIFGKSTSGELYYFNSTQRAQKLVGGIPCHLA
jgi:hypothetical protein